MMFRYKHILIFFLFLLAGRNCYATHARAGEIRFSQISLYTYQIDVIYYTDSRSLANRDNIDIRFGDNTVANVPLSYRAQLKNFTFYNIYSTTHTYPGPGTYVIEFYDPNRIAGIVNMDNSVNTAFYVESQLTINPFMGNNRSPILLQPPIDYAETGQIYTHNPNAYDPDGDSLAFSLITPKQSKGLNVDGFYIPYGQISGFTINSRTGEIIWNYPHKDSAGTYNIAILVEEFRNKQRIGYIIRDMQIIVLDKDNHPPFISELRDTCIEAGQTLTIKVHAYDRDSNQTISLSADGGPFIVAQNPAVSSPNPAYSKINAYATFSWTPNCDHVRKYPYMVVYKAEDNYTEGALADLKCFLIHVIGPAPENLQTTITTKGIKLNWSPPHICNNAKGYYIYRRIDSSYWDTSRCENGIPSYTKFKLIDTVIGINNTTYFDDNQGRGMIPGIEYCYRVTAVYLNEGNYEVTEGYASNEACARLKKDIPVITHVDVRKTDITDGRIFVDWVKPVELDTSVYLPPYKYNILKADNQTLSNYKYLTAIRANSFYELKTISLTDSLLDSKNNSYSYKVEFYCTDNGNDFLIGASQVASSVYLKLTPTHKSVILDWDENVPWTNDLYTIYRLNDVTNNFDSIGFSTIKTYKDSGLINGNTYCYKIRSSGSYSSSSEYISPIINFSEEACAMPRDTIKPCAPVLTANAFCDSRNTQLNWSYTGDSSCISDVKSFRLYFSKQMSNNYQLIKEFDNIYQRSYLDSRSEMVYSLAGCYVITAVDSYDNVSYRSHEVCVDNCPVYDLPNVFSPNSDGKNDTLRPLKGSRFIEKVKITIFNRWGQEVFVTEDPQILWDGKDNEKHEDCSPGVYYYLCEIYEIYLSGTKVRTITGSISLFR